MITIEVEEIERFLDRCENIEDALVQVKTILDSPKVNEALVGITGDPEIEGADDEIIKAFLAMKQVIAKVL